MQLNTTIGLLITSLALPWGHDLMPDVGERKDPLLKAFPVAGGFGGCTLGGQGQKVFFVTAMEDYLPDNKPLVAGSWHLAIEAQDSARIHRNGGYRC